MNRSVDWLVVFLVSVLVVIGVAVLADLWDEVQNYRAFDAKVACEAQRMVPRRKPMEVTVTCVPLPMRQDTTTVNLNGVLP
jgi:hypothetical protein